MTENDMMIWNCTGIGDERRTNVGMNYCVCLHYAYKLHEVLIVNDSEKYESRMMISHEPQNLTRYQNQEKNSARPRVL